MKQRTRTRDRKITKLKDQRKNEKTRRRRSLQEVRNLKSVRAEVSAATPRTSQRSPQVYPTLDRLSLVAESKRCSALRQKRGFLFSKEELHCWQTCQPSILQRENQYWETKTISKTVTVWECHRKNSLHQTNPH